MTATPPVVNTDFAIRYGVSKAPWFANTGKSGATPIAFEPKPPTGADAAYRKFRQREALQRKIYNGFATWELEESGCFSRAKAKPQSFSHHLHPIFTRKNWRIHRTKITDGIKGRWDISSNDTLWLALKPSLLLATQILSVSTMWPWFDALMHSPWHKVDPKDVDDGGPTDLDFYEIWQRRPDVCANEEENILKIWTLLADIILFDLQPLNSGGRHCNGSTGASWEDVTQQKLKIRVWLTTELIKPFLYKPARLTVAQTLSQQFLIAKVLVHELSHAAHIYIRKMQYPQIPKGIIDANMIEPFFEREEIAELGRSAENALYGGYINQVQRICTKTQIAPPDDAWYNVGLATMTFPSFQWKPPTSDKSRNVRHRYRTNFQKNTMAYMWPIPMNFVDYIARNDYWDIYVKKYGKAALRPDRIFGHAELGMYKKAGSEFIALGPHYDKWVKKTGTRISTLLAPGYKEIQDTEGRLIEVDKYWRPRLNVSTPHLDKIRRYIRLPVERRAKFARRHPNPADPPKKKKDRTRGPPGSWPVSDTDTDTDVRTTDGGDGSDGDITPRPFWKGKGKGKEKEKDDPDKTPTQAMAAMSVSKQGQNSFSVPNSEGELSSVVDITDGESNAEESE